MHKQNINVNFRLAHSFGQPGDVEAIASKLNWNFNVSHQLCSQCVSALRLHLTSNIRPHFPSTWYSIFRRRKKIQIFFFLIISYLKHCFFRPKSISTGILFSKGWRLLRINSAQLADIRLAVAHAGADTLADFLTATRDLWLHIFI